MTETSAPPASPRAPQHPGGFGLPVVPGPVETALLLWRRLRRMSTALLLLFALATAAVVATFVPQEPVIPTTVARWRTGAAGPGEEFATVLDALGFFDVFGSWWFTALTVLLFTSLTGCLLPRYAAFAKVARRPPAVGRNLARLSAHEVVATPRPAGEALALADALLRRRRFRRRVLAAEDAPAGAAQLAAERGHWREGGSLMFHTAFYLLLVGAVVGHALGFTGQINLVEGAAFAETRLAYDLAEPGRWWALDDHRGFEVTLDDFDVAYHEDFTPADFVSTVTIRKHGEVVRTEQVRVNHPVVHDGMKLFQARFGMAPRVVVRNAASGEVLFDEKVMLAEAGALAWEGTAKISMGGRRVGDDGQAVQLPQIALDLVLVPDGEVVSRQGRAQVAARSPKAEHPVLLADLYVGEDLGLARNVPASQFDRSRGPVGSTAVLTPRETATMAGGLLTVEFPELAQWSGFQVSHAPGRLLLLVAGGLLLAGLVPSLYSYRRRIWVEVHPEGETTRVVIAGVALQRKEAFAEEFAALANALRERLAPADRQEQAS